MKKVRRKVGLSVLPGEPTDGSGRICIHLFIQDKRGPIVEPHALHPIIGDDGKPVKQKLEARPTRGRLACSPTRRVSANPVRGVIPVTMRSDDPRAVTCPACMASDDYKKMMTSLGV